MTKASSIASVTVAHNGEEALSRHLDALKRQTRKLDEIIVVDNASSDNSLNLLAADHPEVTVLSQPENSGVGGGFAAGIAYAALEKKHDWVWLFDQDSLPEGDSLELLLAGLRYVDGVAASVAILAPAGVNNETQLAYLPHLWRNGLRPVCAGDLKDVSFVDSVISSGTLLRREAVENAGLPRVDFFMDFVDHEYCLRLRRLGYRIAVVASSRLNHTVGEPRKVSFLGSKRVWTDHAAWRQYYMIRNEVFTVWNYYPDWKSKTHTIRHLLREKARMLLLGKRRLRTLMMMCHGFLDGRAGRLGIRFLPQEQLDHTPEAGTEGPGSFEAIPKVRGHGRP